MNEPTGLISHDGTELREGDKVEFVSGTYSRYPYTDLTVTVRWNPIGRTIPAIAIGWYTNKKVLCSFCKDLGYCKETGQPIA